MKKQIVLLVILFGFIYFWKVTTSYRMPPDYNYDSDFGRDLWEMEKIVHGKPTLVGPQFSYAGLRLAPYHFYFFAPVLAVFNSYQAVVFANAGLFVISLVAAFLILRKRFSNLLALTSVVWLGTTSYFILAARSPGNAFSYLPFFLIYLLYIFYAENFSFLISAILGIVAGVIVNYHPIALIPTIFSFIFIALSKKKLSFKEKVAHMGSFFAAFFATFLPVIIFELRHNFVLIKTFFGSRQAEFFGNSGINLIDGFRKLPMLNKITYSLIPITTIGLFTLVFFLFLQNGKAKDKNKFYISIILTILYLVSGRGAVHYFFPTILFLQLTTIFLIKKYKFANLLIAILLLINIVSFPIRLFRPSRNPSVTESSFGQAIDRMSVPKSGINVFLINNTYLSAPGYEYRYILEKNGYRVDDEHEYGKSKYLLVISEGKRAIPTAKNSWELREFGDRKLIDKTEIADNIYYLFQK
ncbi:hypothetical protein B6D29_02760 [Microgenomates bacterium UTCPR1]|nr:MAG: hypothetical protein B6D29_02760 [Microgenomates bacterium UTCPR1]